jgi:predicted helicase
MVKTQGLKHKEKIHRVQVLDPATGTGTFLNEVINLIHSKFEGQEGRWKSYVNDDLLPRIHGFELMIASYTIAHLKLGLNLQNSGYKNFEKRLGVYLTNSLEEVPKIERDLFSIGLVQAISHEAEKAGEIKNDTPIMIVVGNPPYSVSSNNKGEWIQNLIKEYKEGLNEQKINLDDDYIKFIRYGQNYIEKNSEGVLAYISNNSFIDGRTHRRMRESLLKTFDKIYIFDLHGNAKRKEVCPDGSKDMNVFDIQQGVSINIFVKNGKKRRSALGQVFHADLYGTRKHKYSTLNQNSVDKIDWTKLEVKEPYYFFVPKDFSEQKKFQSGFGLDKLFLRHSSGIETQKDNIAIQFDKNILQKIVEDFGSHNENDLAVQYSLGARSKDKIRETKCDICSGKGEYIKILYRPFDERWTYYTGRASGFMARPRDEVMKHFIRHDNVGIQVSRQQSTYNFQHALVSSSPVDRNSISMQTRESTYFLPLFLFLEDGTKYPNLNEKIVSEIEKTVGNTSPENIFDYIYAVLHSPSYREKFKEFLKIDFPRIPYPKDRKQFEKLARKGKDLRELHLMESLLLNKLVTTYPVEGSDKVEKFEFSAGRVFINSNQYFGNVSEAAWNFYIGGYQPAQKWLKDRKGRDLSSEDIEHYQKIIIALVETDRIMKEIDRIYEG